MYRRSLHPHVRRLARLGTLLGVHLIGWLAIRSAEAATPPAISARAVHAALAGSFAGALRYRDYQDSARFVVLPTELTGVLSADSTSVQLDFVYDDGPGKTVRSSDRLALDSTTTALQWGPADGRRPPSTFSVRSLTGGDTIRLVADTEGSDDNRPATIRETISVSLGGIGILKEVRFAGTTRWLFRHEYTLRRR